MNNDLGLGINVLVNSLLQLFGISAGKGTNLHGVFDEHECRHAGNAIGQCQLLALVNVDLYVREI